LRLLSWPRSAAEEIARLIVKVPTVAQRVPMAASPTAARLVSTAERRVFTHPVVAGEHTRAHPLEAVRAACLGPQAERTRRA